MDEGFRGLDFRVSGVDILSRTIRLIAIQASTTLQMTAMLHWQTKPSEGSTNSTSLTPRDSPTHFLRVPFQILWGSGVLPWAN